MRTAGLVEEHAERLLLSWDNGNRKDVLREMELMHPLVAMCVLARMLLHCPRLGCEVDAALFDRLCTQCYEKRVDLL